MSDVTVLGLGAMGSALVRALLADGRRMTVWNRTAAKATPLEQAGAELAPDAMAAVVASPVVIACVANHAETQSIFDGAGAGESLTGRVLVDLSTGTPQDARESGKWAHARGAAYLDGAILAIPDQIGRPDTVILVSGEEAAFDRAEPLLRVLAGGLRHVGGEVGAAAAWDLAVLSHLFGGLIGFYHGARIAEAEGVPVEALGGMLAEIAPVIGEMVRYDAAAIQSGDFSNPQASLRTCWRSLEMVRRQAKEAGLNAEFPAFAAGLFEKGIAAGYGEEEAPALIKVLRSAA